jgi:hypothetical protein
MPLFNTFINAIATLTNTKFGKGALMSITTGNDNTAVGEAALAACAAGSNNTAVGVSALTAVSSGDSNVSIGKESSLAITSGSNNVAVGYQALGSASGATKASNVAVGYQSGSNVTSGSGNTLIGRGTNVSVSTRDFCIAIGRDASAGDSANGEIAIGSAAYPVVTGTTAMTAGAASALPGVPAGWVQIKLNGTFRKFPYWN